MFLLEGSQLFESSFPAHFKGNPVRALMMHTTIITCIPIEITGGCFTASGESVVARQTVTQRISSSAF